MKLRIHREFSSPAIVMAEGKATPIPKEEKEVTMRGHIIRLVVVMLLLALLIASFVVFFLAGKWSWRAVAGWVARG